MKSLHPYSDSYMTSESLLRLTANCVFNKTTEIVSRANTDGENLEAGYTCRIYSSMVLLRCLRKAIQAYKKRDERRKTKDT